MDDLNATTSYGSIVTSVCIRKAPTIRSEQERYLCAHIETEALACYIASCGSNDFEQKLQQIKHLLHLWQSGNTVEISISDANLMHVEQGEENKKIEGTNLTGNSTNTKIPTSNEKPVLFINNTSVSNNRFDITQKRALLPQSLRNKLCIPIVKKCRGKPRC